MSKSELKKTPLSTWHRDHGGKMVDFGGWDMPLQYEPGILQEHLATRRFGGLFDISHMGRFQIKGTSAIPFLQHVSSNNVEALEPRRSQYTLIPDHRGAVIDDAYLYRFGAEHYLLVVNAVNREKDWAHFQEQVREFPGITLEDVTQSLAMLAFQGPLSKQLFAEQIEGGVLPEPFKNRLSQVTLCRTEVVVARTGYTGEPLGFELFVLAEGVEEVWARLYEAGKDRGAVPVGLGARDTLRLEAGLPLYGHEVGPICRGHTGPEEEELPAFALPGARSAVSFSPRKGDYIGRQGLARQFEQYLKLFEEPIEPAEILPRVIRPVAVLDEGVVRQGNEVFVGDRKVGVVTSGTVTPYWGFADAGITPKITERQNRRAIALAYLDATLAPEQQVEIAVRQRRLRAQIVRWHGRSEAPPYFRPMPVGWTKPQPKSWDSVQSLNSAELLLKRSLENHHWRQHRCVNLVPSEMTPSPMVRLLQVSDPVGRYAEHRELLAALGQEVFYYQGTDLVAWAEQRLAAEMASFLECSLVECRPTSGQMANMTVFGALVDYRNRADRRREPQRIRLVMNHHIGKGGHLSAQPMGALRDYVAKDPVTERYAVVNFPVCRDNPYRIDMEETAKLLDRLDPELIIFGKSMVLNPEPVAEIRNLVQQKRPRPVLMYDMSHVFGLVGPHFQRPFAEGADIVTASTHKTFFGPQRGVIGADFAENTPQFDLWKAVRRRAFPGMVSNHHLGTLLGLLLAALEISAFKDEYQPQVIRNAKAFARALDNQGLAVEGDPAVDFTETHQVIVNVGYAEACEIARHLERNNIIVNYQALPGDESFTCSSGLRLGVAEMTRFGMKEPDFEAFAPLLADAVKHGKDVGGDVAEFRGAFRTMQYCFTDDRLEPLKRRLLETF